ncbi:hypothetical protein ASF83_10890 [Plantibacter sp. Leaf171]|uniref:hypothetical protein n=1 Tax=unclassified Plantibacter TaxID=2624265 RepID=UPI0006F8582A|nr:MULTISPECIES: hypothetical protein [unclassified Plantibacter]KQM16338.1 hypothetical protein ASE44_10905 [Plantibacter sp. Leaf1]KQR59471.1 hypothetical protein ASF83_10890 [Plantibacter sp. Leaf171]
MLRLIAFAALGALLGGIIVIAVGPPDIGYAVAGVALPVCIFATVLSLVGRSLGSAIGASPQAVQQAKDARRLGVARIDTLRQTGTQINDQPLCELDLSVQPLNGPAFATTMRTVIPVTAIPTFQPGTERDVAVLLDGGPEVAFIDAGELSADERSRLRVPARASLPFLPLQPHQRIVDGRRRGPLLGVGRAGRPGRFALFAIVAVAAAAIVVVPYHQSVAQAIIALEDGRLRPDLRRPEALSEAQRALQEAIGHDRVVSITVAADFVIAQAPLTVGDTKTDRWEYRYGQVTHQGAASSEPESAAEQFSWSDVALDRMWSLLEEGAEQVDLPVGDASLYLVRSTDTDVHSPTFARPAGPPQVTFSIGDDYGSTSFVAPADGSALAAR